MIEQLWYSMREVCKALNMSKQRLLDEIERGRLPCGILRGSHFYWTERDIRCMAWLEENRHRFVRTESAKKLSSGELGHVYFVQQSATLSIKIGFSKDPQKRISDLQVANAQKLKLIGLIDATRKQEQELHKQFARYRLEGEWFSPEVLSDILQIIQAQQPSL